MISVVGGALRYVGDLEMSADDLRGKVRHAYSEVAAHPSAEHPFPVGRRLAEAVGYAESWLAATSPRALESFAGISCLPCFAEVPAGARVLDLGCGAGLDSLLLAGRAGTVVGVDFSAAMLAQARYAARAASIENARFVQGDAEALPVASGSIDVAVVNGIFNLNPARSAIFRELARAVRPGGAVYAAELVLSERPPDSETLREADWFA